MHCTTIRALTRTAGTDSFCKDKNCLQNNNNKAPIFPVFCKKSGISLNMPDSAHGIWLPRTMWDRLFFTCPE